MTDLLVAAMEIKVCANAPTKAHNYMKTNRKSAKMRPHDGKREC